MPTDPVLHEFSTEHHRGYAVQFPPDSLARLYTEEPYGDDRCHDRMAFRLAEWAAEAQGELVRLRAIVSLLPKTTDGVPFMCGSVFCLGTHGGERTVFEYQAACRFLLGYPAIRSYIAHPWGEGVGECYSTRAAAEAAWENGG